MICAKVTSLFEGTSCYPQDIAVRLIEHRKMINLAHKTHDILQTTFFHCNFLEIVKQFTLVKMDHVIVLVRKWMGKRDKHGLDSGLYVKFIICLTK